MLISKMSIQIRFVIYHNPSHVAQKRTPEGWVVLVKILNPPGAITKALNFQVIYNLNPYPMTIVMFHKKKP